MRRQSDSRPKLKIMPLASFLYVLLYTALAIPSADSNRENRLASIYDALKAKGLPMGLLPKGVTDFKIDESSGDFEVHLDQACNAKFENELHYDCNVTGKLSYGQIESLSGISAKELFLWFQVKSIQADVSDSGIICFDVGVVVKKFSVSLFELPKDCAAAAADEATVEVRGGRFIKDAVTQSQRGEDVL
ncbi:unnamed protein product [Linum tenue]|uniref:Uncharacterized protein n=1 Tax=Linum tenue TaxID=586396 RepID=A0AAV0RQI7_9ROSI|nr:unnamed protein product [Linum tenue]